MKTLWNWFKRLPGAEKVAVVYLTLLCPLVILSGFLAQ